MYKKQTILGLYFLLSTTLNSISQQTTDKLVFYIFQKSCTFSSCHDHDFPTEGLDLQGTPGKTEDERWSEVYKNIMTRGLYNEYANTKNWMIIKPGDPHTSFLFRKINNGLDPDIILHPYENSSMPQYPAPSLSEYDREIIRQWILFGALKDITVTDTNLIKTYYSGKGYKGIKYPLAVPDSSQGFQIHYGPFFVAPLAEDENFARWDPLLTDSVEVNRVDVLMGEGTSHHFILFKYQVGNENAKPFGVRDKEDNAHFYTELVTGNQYSDSVILPKGTAFFWDKSTQLDLNTHFINYSQDSILASEIYVNIYQAPLGSSKQQMFTGLYPYYNLNIPGNGDTTRYEVPVFDSQSSATLFVWAATSHTHKRGIDYDIFLRNANGTKGEQIFEASCKNGIPGCGSPYYNYEEPPIHIFSPLLPVAVNSGFIHTAVFVNQSGVPIYFGQTTNDEMMIMGLFFTLDTLGLSTGVQGNLAQKPIASEYFAYPNPVNSNQLIIPHEKSDIIAEFNLYNFLGQRVLRKFITSARGDFCVTFHEKNIISGLYLYRLTTGCNKISEGKIFIK